jgi:hypothetical protein
LLRVYFLNANSPNAQYIVGNSSRKSEVLKLIAQVLEFDDDMQRRVIARAA